MYNTRKVMSKVIAFALLSFSPLSAFSQTPQEAVDEVFFEREMEARLSRDIEAYLGHNRFIVGVDFKVTGPGAPGGEDSVVVREITTPLPGLPKASETFRKELTPEELAELNQSLQLDEQVGSRSGLVDGQTVNAFTGTGTEVYLVLDTTVNSVQESFILGLISRKLALDVAGGDTVQVVRSTFSGGAPQIVPQPAAADPQPAAQQQQPFVSPFFPGFPQQPGLQSQVVDEVETLNETPEEREERIANAIREAANQAAQAVSDANLSAIEAATEEDFLSRYWWVLLLVGLVLLAAMFVAFRRTPAYPQQMPYLPAPAAPAPAPSSGDSAVGGAAALSGTSTSSLADVRREIATVGLSSPHAVRAEMDSLMAQNRMDLIAPAYRVLGFNLFESLFGDVPAEKQTSFSEYVTERDMSDSQIEAQAREFYARLLRAATDDSDGSRAQAFKFLDKLHISQIIALIKNEKTRVQALVISQLRGKKANDVLQALDAKQRTDVVHELSQFETFPVETFRDVASGLARKVQSVPAVENIATDGVTILINMLDNMNSMEETKVLDELENKNPDLFLKVKKQYFTYNDLARAPQKALGEALLDMEEEVVSRALIGASDAIVRRVMGSLPKRLADSIKEEMQLQRGKASSEQIQEDRKAILKVMRILVREGKIDMEKL